MASIEGGEPPVDGLDLQAAVNAQYWNDSAFCAKLSATKKLSPLDPKGCWAVFFAGVTWNNVRFSGRQSRSKNDPRNLPRRLAGGSCLSRASRLGECEALRGHISCCCKRCGRLYERRGGGGRPHESCSFPARIEVGGAGGKAPSGSGFPTAGGGQQPARNRLKSRICRWRGAKNGRFAQESTKIALIPVRLPRACLCTL